MALITLLGGPVEVSEQECVRLWNTTTIPPEGLPSSATSMRVLSEDEQDLGYGLCHLFWQGVDGDCRVLTAPVWKGSETWEVSPVSPCQDFNVGREVKRDANELVLLPE